MTISSQKLGMTVENVLERTVVRAAAPGGGAESAGVETGSLLVALDGQSTKVDDSDSSLKILFNSVRLHPFLHVCYFPVMCCLPIDQSAEYIESLRGRSGSKAQFKAGLKTGFAARAKRSTLPRLCPSLFSTQDSSHFEVIELLRVANRPLTLRLRRVGRERLLCRRAEMRALTRPHGLLGAFGGSGGGNATGPNGGRVPSVPPPLPPTPPTTTTLVSGAGGASLGSPLAPPPPPPPLPPPPPPPPVRQLRRQDSFPLGDPRRGADSNGSIDSVAGGDAEEGGVAGGVGQRGGEFGHGTVLSVGTAESAATTAAMTARGRGGGAGGDHAREQAAVAAAAAGMVGNWEAVEWAESCLITVSFFSFISQARVRR